MIINVDKTKNELCIDITLLRENSCKNVYCECPNCGKEFIRKYRLAIKHSICLKCSNKINSNTNSNIRSFKIKERWAKYGHPRAGTAKPKIRTKPKKHHKNWQETIDYFNYIIIDKSDCWVTNLKKDTSGYVTIGLLGNRIKAHRFSYIIHKGEIPDGKLIRHLCHNRECVNPDHLEIGTTQDNSNDMVNAGRSLIGSKNKSAKLTEKDILVILELLKTKKVIEIAKMYNVGRGTIGQIKNKKRWNHVKDTPPTL